MKVKMIKAVGQFERGKSYELDDDAVELLIANEDARIFDQWDEFIDMLDNSPNGKLNASFVGAMRQIEGR